MGINRDSRAGDDFPASGSEITQSSSTENANVGASQPANPFSHEDDMPHHAEVEEIKAKDVFSEADRGMNARKPWKEKKKAAQNRGATDEIEIFEGKGVVSGPSLLEITSPDKGYLKVMCKDDCEFLVPLKVVESFQCVDVILHSDAMFKEKLENVIRFPDIQPEIMEYVLRFVFIEHLNKLKATQYWGEDSPRLVFQFEVNPLQVMDLIYVAHFLGIEDLLNVTATMVARHMQDVPDLSSMPVDLAWCVARQFTAQELYEAEERQDFLSLNLETDVLWEKHCKKFLIEDIIPPTASSESPPSYDTWGLSEGPPPTSWKSLFIALDLQQLADRQDGSTNESFFAEIEQKGKYAYSHTIRSMFYEWVLRAPASLPFFSYIARFPNLMSLHLVNLPLGSPLADGEIPCMVVGEILQNHPQLQILDASETGFTTEAAILLSQSLKSHPRLQVLRLAYNMIGTDGFSAIAKVLPHVRTLKYLDVRENGIASAIAEDAVEALRSSGLEELLLDGNLKSRRCSYSNANGPSKSSVTAPGQSHGKSVQAQEAQLKPFKLVVPVLGGIPPNLKKLQLTQCDLVDSDISILVVALRQLNVIQKLDLSDNSITATGAASIFAWLQGNDSLLELRISNNQITDSCSDSLLQAIRSHSKLQKVEGLTSDFHDSCSKVIIDLQLLNKISSGNNIAEWLYMQTISLLMFGNYSYGERNLLEIINAAVVRGDALVSSCGLRFTLDLRVTDAAGHATAYRSRGRIANDIANSTRAHIQSRASEWTNKLQLLI